MNPRSHHQDRTDPNPAPLPGTAMDGAITRALGRPPQLRIPADFAARVASQATRQPQPRASSWIGWGPRLTLGSGALLTLALFALAPHAAPTLTNARFDAELVIFAELSTLLLFAPRLLSRE